jgi:RNA polymerase sigma-70 factor (ECF subfamily)
MDGRRRHLQKTNGLIFRKQSSAAVLPGPEEDNRLVVGAKTGDRRAFDALMRAHRDALRGFVIMRIGQDAAEDILQEVWMACWQGIGKFSGKSRFKSWLYGIAVNKCADHHRGHIRMDSQSLCEVEELQNPVNTERQIILKESIRAALSRLQDAQREVVELYYYAELTLPEIAQALKRNLNTVKYQFYRAHDQVARELGPEKI